LGCCESWSVGYRILRPICMLMLTPVRAKEFAVVRKAVLDLGPHDKY